MSKNLSPAADPIDSFAPLYRVFLTLYAQIKKIKKMSKFIELNSGKDKFIVNVNSISYVERSDLSGSVVHFAYSRPDATAVLYVDQSLDQIRELIAE